MSKKFLNLITYVDESSNDQVIDLQTSVLPNTVPLRDKNGVFEVGDIELNDDGSYVVNKKYITDKLGALDSSSSSDTFVFGVSQIDGLISTTKRPLNNNDGVLLTGDIAQDVYGEKIFGDGVTFSEGAIYSSSIDDNSSDLLLINKKYADKKLGVLSLDDSASASSFDNVSNFVRAAITKSKKNSLDEYLWLSTPQGESDQILSQPATFAGDNSFDSSVEFYRMLRSSEPSKPNDVINYNFYLEAMMEKDNLMLAKVESSTGGSYTIGVKKSPGLTKINWGDGSVEYIGSDNSYEHTYTDGSTHYEMFYNVESIASDAFAKQSCLKEIIIPNGIINIGSSAFHSCSGLTSVTIPDSVTSIGEQAFHSCSALTSVNWNATNCISAGSGLFGDAVVFYNCLNLLSINFGENVINIPPYAFAYCRGLTSVTIPDSVTSIGYAAFYNCSSLTSVTVDANNAVYRSDGNCLIEKGTNILILGCKNSIIPNGVITIGSSAFHGCSGLTSVTIPDSVTSIGDEAFSGCSGLASVTIGNGVASIGDYAFYQCYDLTSVTIGDSVETIGVWAFYNCWHLTSITIPDSVTSIGDGAFRECSGLRSITIPDSVAHIEQYAFYNCRDLASVTVTRSTPASLGAGAFYGTKSSFTIYVPSTLVSNYQSAWSAYSNKIVAI